MTRHLIANLWLLVLTVVACCVLYPLTLLGIGQIAFHDKANGSLILDDQGRPIGSRLIAQPFTGDEYFHPRPSAASYNAAASGATNWGANNPNLRKRVLAMLGTTLKFGPHAPSPGQPIGPAIEAWFQQDQFGGKPGVVAQWASQHPDQAQAWVGASEANGKYVAGWMKDHATEVAQWVKNNPGTPQPTPADVAPAFFAGFSKDNPGRFPRSVTHEGSTETTIGPVQSGAEIQTLFFPMWREDNPDVDVAPIPADMVMASGCGLDPDITLASAQYQLDCVAAAWAAKTSRPAEQMRGEIEVLLNQHTHAPLGGLVGVNLVNVLDVNLALRDQYR